MLANKVDNEKQGGQRAIGGLNVRVIRNYFGSQQDSFTNDISIPILGAPFPGVFIRAPVISECDADVQVLAQIPPRNPKTIMEDRPLIVAVRQNHLLGTAFHPELTSDTRVHDYFVRMVQEYKQ